MVGYPQPPRIVIILIMLKPMIIIIIVQHTIMGIALIIIILKMKGKKSEKSMINIMKGKEKHSTQQNTMILLPPLSLVRETRTQFPIPTLTTTMAVNVQTVQCLEEC